MASSPLLRALCAHSPPVAQALLAAVTAADLDLANLTPGEVEALTSILVSVKVGRQALWGAAKELELPPEVSALLPKPCSHPRLVLLPIPFSCRPTTSWPPRPSPLTCPMARCCPPSTATT